MTDQQKKWLMIGAAATVAVVMYQVLKPKTDTSGGAEDPTGNGSTNGNNATFNPSAVAEKLYNAMKNTGTNEMAVTTALTPVNQAQFALVREKFGKRSYNSFLGNQIRINPLVPLPLVNLPGWLESELSTTRYNLLQTKYPNHL